MSDREVEHSELWNTVFSGGCVHSGGHSGENQVSCFSYIYTFHSQHTVQQLLSVDIDVIQDDMWQTQYVTAFLVCQSFSCQF